MLLLVFVSNAYGSGRKVGKNSKGYTLNICCGEVDKLEWIPLKTQASRRTVGTERREFFSLAAEDLESSCTTEGAFFLVVCHWERS